MIALKDSSDRRVPLVDAVEEDLGVLINKLKISHPESETEILSSIFMELLDVVVIKYGVAQGLAWVEGAVEEYCGIVLEMDDEALD